MKVILQNYMLYDNNLQPIGKRGDFFIIPRVLVYQFWKLRLYSCFEVWFGSIHGLRSMFTNPTVSLGFINFVAYTLCPYTVTSYPLYSHVISHYLTNDMLNMFN